LVYRGKLIALDSPDSLKQSARTSELPNPTMEEAFIELINRFDEQEKSTTPREARTDPVDGGEPLAAPGNNP